MIKKLLIFIFLILPPFNASAATNCYLDAIMARYDGDPYGLSSLSYLGHYNTTSEAYSAVISYGNTYVIFAECEGNPFTYGSGLYYNARANYSDGGVWYYNVVYATWNTEYTGEEPGADPSIEDDSDGDGLSDESDMYPNDPTPYKIKLFTYYTEDGTSTGEHTGEVWITDRGDFFSIGLTGEDNPGQPWLAGGSSEWEEPYEYTEKITPGTGGSPINPTSIPYSPDAPTGDAPTGTDGSLTGGQQSDGTETDNIALRGIKDNTGIIADNTKRQGEYLKDLNKNIQEMNRNLSGGSLGGDPYSAAEKLKKEAEQKQEAEEAENNMNGIDVDSVYSTLTDAAQLVEGETGDYQNPGELTEETFFTDFFNSNPLIAAFNDSGFDTSGGSSSMTLTLPGLGTHTLDLSPLQSGFAAFGNLLLAFCSLGSLIMIVRG